MMLIEPLINNSKALRNITDDNLLRHQIDILVKVVNDAGPLVKNVSNFLSQLLFGHSICPLDYSVRHIFRPKWKTLLGRLLILYMLPV